MSVEGVGGMGEEETDRYTAKELVNKDMGYDVET